MAKRYFLHLAYDGTPFHGWQIQPNAKTIQETLNQCLTTLLRTDVYTVGCGRTDTGVHAKSFYAHFDVDSLSIEPTELVYRLNRVLPESIAIIHAFEVDDEAHARFSATARSYTYLITQRKDPFAVNRMWELRESLDLEAMNRGANLLLAHTDFGCFSKSNTQTETNDCTITRAQWLQEGDILRFEISANRFLRNMVRAIVGTLVDMGRGKLDEQGLKTIIESKDRSEAGTSVPAHGLYLTAVSYPKGVVQ